MGVIKSNGQFSVTKDRMNKVILDKIITAEKSQTFYRHAKNRLEETQLNKPQTQFDGAQSLRIKSLEKELQHYRCMLDKMVQQKTDQLNCRLAILESCNSKLGENYHNIHQMYLDLLVKTQSHEAEQYQRTLEVELSMPTLKPLT